MQAWMTLDIIVLDTRAVYEWIDENQSHARSWDKRLIFLHRYIYI